MASNERESPVKEKYRVCVANELKVQDGKSGTSQQHLAVFYEKIIEKTCFQCTLSTCLLQGTDITIQELRPFMLVYQRGVQLRPTLVVLHTCK